jgi:4-amino-4-deoxy-L-arabinose transferase-like glycosyltransferase
MNLPLSNEINFFCLLAFDRKRCDRSIASFWLRDGMFGDGVLYAAVSQNLANGIGSTWQPILNFAIEKPFLEQPPLAFWLQAAMFRIGGNSFFVERLFCAINYVTICLSIYYVWKKMVVSEKKQSWLPVLFFTITPLVFWSYRNNMLENTMLIFDFWAVFCFYQSAFFSNPTNKNKDLIVRLAVIFLGSFCIFLAFLTKGVVGLFPLGVFLGQWLFLKKISFGETCKRSILATFFLLLFFATLFYFSPKALSFFQQYLENQLFRSLRGERELVEGGNRFFLLIRLGQELILMFLPFILVKILLFLKNKQTLFAKKIYSEEVIFWIYIGLSASLPMLISPKQHAYYLVPAFPYFAIASALLTGHYLAPLLDMLSGKKAIYICSILLIVSLLYVFLQEKKPIRDAAILHDVHILEQKIEHRNLLSLDGAYCEEYFIGAYLLRYGSFDTACESDQPTFFLSKKDHDLSAKGYSEVTMGLEYFRIWKKSK